jgi:hypothetical protein
MAILRDVKRPYRKMYQPAGMDLFDPKVHKGKEIPPGTMVVVLSHFGPFRYIADAEGNEMSVGKGSLQPVGRP